MNNPFSHLDAVTGLLVAALGDRLAPGVSDYIDLFHEDGVLETPYVPEGSPYRWEGKPAIAAFLEQLRDVVRLADLHLTGAYSAEDNATVVLEYEGTVHLERQGRQFQQRYISVVRTERGRIALWREYTNPLASKSPA